MQQVQTNAPSNAAARVPAATNNNTHTGAAKPAVAPLQLLKDLAAEEPVETGPQRHIPQESWSAVQQKQERLQPALQKKENTGPNVLQRKGAYLLQRPWAANYEESGLTVEGVFSDADITRGHVINDKDKGTVAHEHIQKANGGWIPEYGIPPVPPDVAWHYADMVKDKDIYEIKPEGGEDAADRATEYVGWANVANPGHKLATAAFNTNTPLFRKQQPLLSPATRQVENDTFEVSLHYKNVRAGEILYKWKIKNLSAEERKRNKEKGKREEKKDKETKEKNEKIQKGQAFSIASWAKKSPAEKTVSPVAESPSATAEPTEAPETEAEEPVAEERTRVKEKRKRDDKNELKKKEKDAKAKKEHGGGITSYFKKAAPGKTKSAIAESPSATAEPTEAPEAEEQEQTVEPEPTEEEAPS